MMHVPLHLVLSPVDILPFCFGAIGIAFAVGIQDVAWKRITAGIGFLFLMWGFLILFGIIPR